MSFHWRLTPGTVTSTCAACGWTIRNTERDVLVRQRAHSWQSCQQRRAETTRVVEAERATEALAAEARCLNGHLRAGNSSIDNRGHVVCLACQRARHDAKNNCAEARVSQAMAAGLGVALGTIEASEAATDVTPGPPLNTPSNRSIQVKNTQASATPSRNSKGVA